MAMRGELPSGTVTFLFTDLLDSTQLWESHPREMRDAVRRHDELVRHAVEVGGGYVVKTMGDGAMAVFADPVAAVDAAVALQREIHNADWNVPMAARMGLHTGTAQPEDGDYHSPTVNRAARVAGSAAPGQILVTAATAALIDRHELRDLGEREMRGLPAVRVSQVLAAGLRADFPAPASVRRGRLPTSVTSFIGRERELAAVEGLLQSHPFVTLVGAGGCGKTRLAIEVADSTAARYADGMAFTDLASVVDDARVPLAVSEALGLSVSDAATDDERVITYLANHALLVILDNCEHLLDAVAALVDAVLARGGTSQILATSREPLGVVGEQVYVVPSLATETDAVALFVARAAESRAGFELDDTNRAAILEIVSRLDGIPLAIELAAPSARHLSPAQIVERLDDRFRLLTGGRRRVQRHQTLAAALDWSHELLTDDEQCVLRRLATFPASFSLEAAEYVVDRADTFDRLSALVDKSLVNAVPAGDLMRYRLLESVRLYVEPKLVEADESFACRRRQRDWVVQWLESIPLDERWFGDVDYLGREQANVRAAIDWSAAQREREPLARLASGVDWARSEAWREGRARCLEVDAGDDIETELDLQVAMMLWWLGPISADGTYTLQDRDAETATGFMAGRRSVESLSRSMHEYPLHSLALTGHGRDLTIEAERLGDKELAARIVQLVTSGVERSDRFSQGWRKIVHLMAGMAYASLRRLAEADAAFTAGMNVAPGRAPFEFVHGSLEGYLAITRLVLGRVDDALELAQSAEKRTGAALAAAAFPYWVHAPGVVLPIALGEAGDHAAAHDALIEYDKVQRQSDFRDGLKSVCIVGGALAAQRQDWERAALLIAAGAMIVSRTPADYLMYLHYRDRVRVALPPDDAHRLREEGRAMPIEVAAELALQANERT